MTYAVKFEDVVKRYPRGGPRYASIRHDLAGGIRRLGSRLTGHRPEPLGTLALDGLSFEVAEGESFAIIGPNGAGKTTALKLISRISYPSGGRVRVRGRVAALIEVGSGVHPELTARENILLYGRILGMGKAEVRRRFDEIVEFSELADFLDTPVKMYSSGMQLRLGFSIASHMDPDVFLVDEALAVGDAGFQAKCVERMSNVVSEGRSLLFVSHNLPAVESLCQRGVWLLRGRPALEGPTKEVLARYIEWVEERRLDQLASARPEGSVRIVSASCYSLDGEKRHRFEQGEGLEIRLLFESTEPLTRPYVNIGISDGRAGVLARFSMLRDGDAPDSVPRRWECRCRIDWLPLRPRLYEVFCDLHGARGHGQLLKWAPVTGFRVIGEMGTGPRAVADATLGGAIDLPYAWQFVPLPDADVNGGE